MGQKWLEKLFIKQVRAKEPDPNQWILLILDGHGSHVADKFVKFAAQHKVHVVLLPPHTTHKLQPLDVGCFGPFKKRWADRCKEYVALTGETMPKENFAHKYLAIRNETITENVIKSAFRKTGIAPFNPDVFGPLDFAPSHSTSTLAHLPDTYPSATLDNCDVLAEDLEDKIHWESGRSSEVAEELDAERQHTHTDADIEEEEAEAAVTEETDNELEEVETTVEGTEVEADFSLSGASTTSTALPGMCDPFTSQGSSTSTPASSLLVVPQNHVPILPKRAQTVLRTPAPPHADDTLKLHLLEQDFRRLVDLFHGALTRAEAAETHARMAALENQQLHAQLNAKAAKALAPAKRLQSKYTVLTCDEALAEIEESAKEQAVKDQLEHEKQAVEEQKKKDDLERRRKLDRNNAPFDGRLSKKKRTNWEDIAYVLRITFEGVVVRDLISAITGYLREHRDLQLSPQFSALWHSLSKGEISSVAEEVEGVENAGSGQGTHTVSVVLNVNS